MLGIWARMNQPMNTERDLPGHEAFASFCRTLQPETIPQPFRYGCVMFQPRITITTSLVQLATVLDQLN